MKKCLNCELPFEPAPSYRRNYPICGKCTWLKQKERRGSRLEYNREYYNKEDNKHKRRVRALVSAALRDKRLYKSSCLKCGNEKSEAHHEDYSKPLEVIWLCKSCHVKRHIEINNSVKAEEKKSASIVEGE